MRAAARTASVAVPVSFAGDKGKQRFAAERRTIGRMEVADPDFSDPLEPLCHYLHVGLHDSFAQSTELLDVLLVNGLVELFLRDAELVEERRHGKKAAQERVPLHTKLEVAPVGGLAGDFEPRQGKDPYLLLDDLLTRPEREPFPGLLAFLVRLPEQASALRHPVERVGVRKCLRIAAQDDVDVTEVAIDPDALRRRNHEVGGWRTLLLRSVFWVRADVNNLLRITELIDDAVAFV